MVFPTPKLANWADVPIPAGIEDNPALLELARRGGELPVREPAPELFHCSANEIVPEELQNRLMALDDAMTRCYFEIGDIANDLIKHAPQVMRENRQKIITEQDVFNAVGLFCHRSGRTVRYYSETAEFYAVDVRSEFDMLPFTHFVVARSFGNHWREVLEFARDNPMLGEERLRRQFELAFDAEYERSQAFYDSHPEIAAVVSQELERRAGEPRSPRSPNALLLSALSSLVDRLHRLAGSIEDETIREKTVSILASVSDLILDVQKDITAHVI